MIGVADFGPPTTAAVSRAPVIAIAGAGSIGCFVGGQLAAAGRDVRFLGRDRVVDELRSHGLTLTDRDAGRVRVEPERLAATSDPATALAGADIVLVTVKSSGTREIGRTVAELAPARAVVVSLQNGIDNAAILREELPARGVIAGMVPFNVVALGEGRLHRGIDGDIVIDAAAATLVATLSTPHLPVRTHHDMVAVAWGKLLLNLNNALNALAGVPLREELSDRRWRVLLARCIDEALAALQAAGIRPARVGAVPPSMLPSLLRLPDALFRIVAAAQVRIDPKARSSMQDDLAQHRTTEIDQLQGAVVALAARHGLRAATNALVLDRIKAAELRGEGSPRVAPDEIGR